MSLPSNKMRPESGFSKPAAMRRSVVFPQPDGPNRENVIPWVISRETSSTAVNEPKRLVTWSKVRVPCIGWAEHA